MGGRSPCRVELGVVLGDYQVPLTQAPWMPEAGVQVSWIVPLEVRVMLNVLPPLAGVTVIV